MPRNMMRNSNFIALKHLTNRTPNDPCIPTTCSIHPSNHLTRLTCILYSLTSIPPSPLLPSLPSPIPRSNIRIQPHTLRRYLPFIPHTTPVASPSTPPTTSPSTSTFSPTSLLQFP
ncbi:hypothetical protein BDQ94DRAFT_174053 [Aspergillus welwitschiae]|nr:hypothetical protein BDQ94DRAFT_174053 [Aspergillus welwitschiae]RDH29269.1 hypothetical protein BDQ94DRAFT_174053 [Aspergillus welwitschiae]GKZ55809.1 hypothetical protein AnigIFM49718_000975 [Aspergillus niger]